MYRLHTIPPVKSCKRREEKEGVEWIAAKNETLRSGGRMLALSVDGQGRSGSGGDIFIASPPNPPPSHMLAGPNSKSGLWPPIDGTKYAQHSHLNNGRGLNRAANGGTWCIFI